MMLYADVTDALVRVHTQADIPDRQQRYIHGPCAAELCGDRLLAQLVLFNATIPFELEARVMRDVYLRAGTNVPVRFK